MIEIEFSKFNGKIQAPPSKSHAIRYIILSALIEGESLIENTGKNEDVMDAINILKSSYINYREEGNKLLVNSNGRLNFKKIYVKGSATVLRIALAIAAGLPGKKEIYMGETLRKRPVEEEIKSLEDRNLKITKLDDKIVVDGMVSKRDFEVEGKISSQFITALMYLSPLIRDDLTINIKNGLVSKTYLHMTVNVFRDLGMGVKIDENTIEIKYREIKPFRKKIPGDFPLSSYFAVMDALNGENVIIENLDIKTSDDSKIIEIFGEAGIDSRFSENSWIIRGENVPEGLERSMVDYPDLVPPLVAIGANAKNKTILKNIGHLKYKESDRIGNLLKILNLYGAEGYLDNSDLIIFPSRGRRFFYSCPGDHRMAMTAITLQSRVSGILENELCLNKSYPEFLSDFSKIGGKYHEI